MSFVSTTDIISILQGVSQKAGQGIKSWTANTQYTVGNLVIYNNNLYKCITANSDATFDDSKWQIIGGSSGGSSVNVIMDTLWEGQAATSANDMILSTSCDNYDMLLIKLYVYENGYGSDCDTLVWMPNPETNNYRALLSGGSIPTSSTASVDYWVKLNREGETTISISSRTHGLSLPPTNNAIYIGRIQGIKFCHPNVYSTTEQRVGTWIDGKPLYQKTYTGVITSTTGREVLESNFGSNGYTFIEASGICGGFSLPATSVGGHAEIAHFTDDGTLSIAFDPSIWPKAGAGYSITVKYTKT